MIHKKNLLFERLGSFLPRRRSLEGREPNLRSFSSCIASARLDERAFLPPPMSLAFPPSIDYHLHSKWFSLPLTLDPSDSLPFRLSPLLRVDLSASLGESLFSCFSMPLSQSLSPFFSLPHAVVPPTRCPRSISTSSHPLSFQTQPLNHGIRSNVHPSTQSKDDVSSTCINHRSTIVHVQEITSSREELLASRLIPSDHEEESLHFFPFDTLGPGAHRKGRCRTCSSLTSDYGRMEVVRVSRLEGTLRIDGSKKLLFGCDGRVRSG